MAFSSWWQRQALWKRITMVTVAAYAVGVPLNLLVRLALRGWEWYPDLWLSVLVTSATVPLTIPLTAAMQKWAAKREPGFGNPDRREAE